MSSAPFLRQVADFGLAKHLPSDDSHVETRLAGTFGFLAPEALMTGGKVRLPHDSKH